MTEPVTDYVSSASPLRTKTANAYWLEAVHGSSFLLLALFFISAPMTAGATENNNQTTLPTCNSQSERLVSLGYETYFSMESELQQLPSRDLKSLQHDISAFYETLEGRWEGTMVDHICKRSENGKLQHKEQHYRLSWVENQLAYNGDLDMRMERVRLQEKRGRMTPVSLQQSRHEFRNSKGLVAVHNTTPGSFTFYSQYRQANNNPLFATSGNSLTASANTFARERKDVVTLKGKALTVLTHWYTNGIYTGTEFYSLEKMH